MNVIWSVFEIVLAVLGPIVALVSAVKLAQARRARQRSAPEKLGIAERWQIQHESWN